MSQIRGGEPVSFLGVVGGDQLAAVHLLDHVNRQDIVAAQRTVVVAGDQVVEPEETHAEANQSGLLAQFTQNRLRQCFSRLHLSAGKGVLPLRFAPGAFDEEVAAVAPDNAGHGGDG